MESEGVILRTAMVRHLNAMLLDGPPPPKGVQRLNRVLVRHLNTPTTFLRAWEDRACGPIDTSGLASLPWIDVLFDKETPHLGVSLRKLDVLRTLARRMLEPPVVEPEAPVVEAELEPEAEPAESKAMVIEVAGIRIEIPLQPEPEPEPAPQPEPEPAPQPVEPEPQPEPPVEPEPEPQPVEPIPQPELEPTPQPEPEPTPEPQLPAAISRIAEAVLAELPAPLAQNRVIRGMPARISRWCCVWGK